MPCTQPVVSACFLPSPGAIHAPTPPPRAPTLTPAPPQRPTGPDGHPELYSEPLASLRDDFVVLPRLLGHLVPQSVNVWMGAAQEGGQGAAGGGGPACFVAASLVHGRARGLGAEAAGPGPRRKRGWGVVSALVTGVTSAHAVICSADRPTCPPAHLPILPTCPQAAAAGCTTTSTTTCTCCCAAASASGCTRPPTLPACTPWGSWRPCTPTAASCTRGRWVAHHTGHRTRPDLSRVQVLIGPHALLGSMRLRTVTGHTARSVGARRELVTLRGAVAW